MPAPAPAPAISAMSMPFARAARFASNRAGLRRDGHSSSNYATATAVGNRSSVRIRRARLDEKSPRRSLLWGFDGLAETEGFEPSMQLITACSLSRGVPSTTRPRLQLKLVF